MELFITLLGIWLVAPVPLLILTIVFGCNSKKLKEQIKQLEKENELLRNKASEVPPTACEQVLSADNEAAAAENTQSEQPNVTETVQPPITEPPKAETPPPCQSAPNAESRYNMPYYGSAKSNGVPPVPQAAKSTPAPAERAHKVSSINVMLILGALFIIISGLIFATTAWKFLSSGVRAIVIFSFSAVFFAVSSLAERKFKLPKTGVLFYTLGSTFLPITLIAAGYFKVFGEWFSLFGGGRALLLALTFAALSAVCIKGSCDYKSKAFSWCGLISFSAAVCSLIYQFTEDSIAVSALAVSIYSFAALFLCDILSKKQSERFDVLISQLNTFAAVNTLILSISGIITTCSKEANGIISLIACIIFAAGYLKSSFTEKNGFSGAIPFTVLITFGMFAAFSPDNFRDVTCTVTLISVIPAALSLMGLVPEKLRGALKIISNIGAVIALVFCAAAALATEPSWLALGAYAILAAEILVLGLMHKNEANGKAMLNVFPAACGVIALFLSRLIFSYTETPNKLLYTILTFTAFTAVLQVLFIFVFRTKLRTAASDVIFALSSGIAMFFVLEECEYSAWLVLVSCLVTVGTVLLPAFDTEKPWKNTLFSSAAMIWSGFMAIPLSQLTENAVPQLSLSVSRTIILTSFSIVLTAVSAAVTFLCKNKTTDTAVSVTLRLILSSYFIYLAALGNAFISPVFFIIAAICLFRGIKLKSNAEFTISNLLGIILAGLAAYDANRHFGFEHIILFMCGMAAVIYIICLFTHESGGSFEKISNLVSRYGMLVLTSLALFYLSVDGSPFSVAYTLMTLLFFLLTATAFYNSRLTVPLIIPFILFYTAAVNSLEEFFISAGCFVTYEDHLVNPILTYRNYSPTAIAAAVMIIISIALSYILHRDSVLGKENRKMPDCFAITRFVGVIIYFNEALGDKDEWFSIWLTAACLLSLCRSEQKPVFRRWIYTVVLTAPVIAWIFQPFFELPDVIELELKILPVLIYCAVIRMLWKEKLTVIDNVTFGIYAFSYLLLFADALSSGLIADGLIIVITSFILLVFSFIVKKKKWFILSVAVLLTATLFMSRNFWASLAWWVYLLAAGLILIAIGAANELKKQSAAKENKSEFEKKVTRFMSEWTW